MKRVLKQLAQHTAALAAPVLLRAKGTSLLVLMYHRVLPQGHPDREFEQAGMYVSPESLSMHIDVLRRHFTLVHLDDWIRDKARGVELPKLSCALTFDDGWLDNYQFAFPVLRAASAPATIYLVSDLVGTRYSFWPNRLMQLLKRSDGARAFDGWPERLRLLVDGDGRTGPMTDAQIDAVIARCKLSFNDAEIEAMLDEIAARQPGGAGRDLMNWEEIREMHSSGLVRFGSHSRRHTRLLESLSDESVRDEVVESGEVIARQIGAAPVTFCYPNGDHSAASVGVVRRHYAAATTTRRGWNSPRSDAHLLARVGLHEDVSSTPAALLARLVGIG